MTVTSKVLTDVSQLEAIRAEWTALLERSAANAPVLTPSWLLAWWKTFGPLGDRALKVLLLSDGGRLVGLAPLLSRPVRSRVGIPFRRLELLGSGEDEADEINSDYIGVIAERGAEESVATALAVAIASKLLGPWDELSLEAMSGDSAFPLLLTEALEKQGIAAHTAVTAISHHIRLPATFEAYLAALPSTRRYLIRRTMRDFERWAGTSMRLERAATPEGLAHGMKILESLHGERWRHDGQVGAYASPRFRAFHEAVMPELLEAGALELLWVTVDNEPIAIAYNLIWEKKLYFYQSGRSTHVPRGIRPGIVMHAYAIRDAIAGGFREYDFLPGTARYKADLALDARPIVHLSAVRPSLTCAARRATELAIDQVRAFRALRLAQKRATQDRVIAAATEEDNPDPAKPSHSQNERA